MIRQILTVSAVLAGDYSLAACCGGDTECAEFSLVDSIEHKPIIGARIRVFNDQNRDTPIAQTSGTAARPGIYTTAGSQCSGTTTMEITHPQFQTMIRSYTSPNPRDYHCSYGPDRSTIELVAR